MCIRDSVYIEPMTLEVVERILDIEKPDSVLPNLGGQMGLNLSLIHISILISSLPGARCTAAWR